MAQPKQEESKLNTDDDVRVTDKYILFNTGCFGQWYQCEFIVDDVKYFSAEQFMMAGKAKVMDDKDTLALILKSNDPSECKQLGRKIKPWDQEKWDANKEDIVYNGNYAKFSQNEDLKKEILSYDTKKIFVEASAYDKIWGIGLDTHDKKADDKSNWEGTNLLGQQITKVRDELNK